MDSKSCRVYTGGGTAGESATGLAGFINQVIKTGTYPGYATVSGGIGSTTYYHSLQVEAGGATPDRLFSYYVGIGGYNQDYRYLDQFNGSNLGLVWGYPAIAFNTIPLYFGGVFPNLRHSRRRAVSGFYSRTECVAGLRSVPTQSGTTGIRAAARQYADQERPRPRSRLLPNDYARLTMPSASRTSPTART